MSSPVIYLKDYQPPDYLIDQVDLQFHLEEAFALVKSQLLVRVNPDHPHANRDLVLVGDELELISVAMNGLALEKTNYAVDASQLTIFNVPEQFSLDIETRIYPKKNTALSGLYQSSGNFCTQCEAHGFRRITYFLDRPDVMALYRTTIFADQKRYPILLSNGNCVDKGSAANGKHWVTWVDPFKKPCYLFALVAGDLEFIDDFFITQSGRRAVLRIFVEKGNLDKCAHAMQAVKKSMRWDEEHYGREYDLDIFMIVAVSDFNMGAMENKGLNIFNTQYILAKSDTATDMDYIHVESVIAHEYFHNWTGNRITCRDWFQLSLKEGLTIFRDQSFTADTTSKTVARIHDVNDLRNSQFIEDAGPLAHSVRPDSYIEINNFYTSTVYNKGAEVIRMQKTLLGDELFRKGMDIYFSSYDGKAVTTEEFVHSMELASGLDLTQFRLWYTQAGTPQVIVTDYYDAAKQVYSLTFKQSCKPTPGQPVKLPFHIPIKMGLLDRQGHELHAALLQLTDVEHTFHFEQINEKPILSLLREFSAPIKIDYQYSDADLLFLFKHDTDGFNRWEAGQRYAVSLIMKLIADYYQKKAFGLPNDYIDALRWICKNGQTDKLLLSEMLTLPAEKYLAEQMDIIDVDAIHQVREWVLLQIAISLKDEFIELYQQNHSIAPYQFDMVSLGERQLKNVSLAYLTLLADSAYIDLALKQFEHALMQNMTDCLAAFRALSNLNTPAAQQANAAFFKHWQHDALVLDKWFSIQATAKLPDTLASVKQLLNHPAFDIKNPNKVYALIGAFGHRNLVNFHAISGEGYQFLADCVLKLDALNPQIAARMVKPLVDWRRFDQQRQRLMREQLVRILANKPLSNDVFELVSKSLQ